MKGRLLVRRSLIALAVLALAIQLVPYGRASNPTVVAEPAWDSPRTRDLARRACFDCHSNETHWPWYSRVAPVSWLVRHDVDEGRAQLNVSEWTRPSEEAGEAAGSVLSGEMPPKPYLLLHPTARLSAADRAALMEGLTRTFGAPRERSEADERDEESEDDEARLGPPPSSVPTGGPVPLPPGRDSAGRGA